MNVTHVLKLKAASEVETIAPEASIADAAKILGERRYGALIVTDGESGVAGIISERDIVRGIGEKGANALKQTVGDLMTAKVEHCTPDENVNSVMSRMTAGRFRHMPVMEKGRLAGVLSIGDVVKARIMEIEQEKQAMEGMLAGQY